VKGGGGRWFIERKHRPQADKPMPRPDEALQALRDVLEVHRLDFEVDGGRAATDLAAWMGEEYPDFDHKRYGFQEFNEFLNFAQDKLIVRLEPSEELGMMVHLGAEFYPPAPPQEEARDEDLLTEHDFVQPIVPGQPTATGEIPLPEPPAPKPKKRVTRKKAADGGSEGKVRRSRRKKPE
jgi:hypothetical protein